MTDKQENAGQHVADPQPEPSHREPTLLEKLGVKEGSTAQGLVEIVGESFGVGILVALGLMAVFVLIALGFIGGCVVFLSKAGS